jgi:hypothetical protein
MLAIAVLCAIAYARPALAGDFPLTMTGQFLTGTGTLGYVNPCQLPAVEGITGNCVTVPVVSAGHTIDIQTCATVSAFGCGHCAAQHCDAAIPQPMICYFDASYTNIGCTATPSDVPETTRYVAVGSIGGVFVSWTFTIT